MNTVNCLHDPITPKPGFILDPEQSSPADGQYCYALDPEHGQGRFWNYFCKDWFIIDKRDFTLYQDLFFETGNQEFMTVQYCFPHSGEELTPSRQLSPNHLRYYAEGSNTSFQVRYPKNTPLRSVSISLMPAFCQSYLRRSLTGDYPDFHHTLRSRIAQADSPKLAILLKQIDSYAGHGVPAQLFYAGKVLEALALILDASKPRQDDPQNIVSPADAVRLNTAAEYIQKHLSDTITSEQLGRIAYMGTTKLKTKFKAYFGCGITDYILHQRIDRSQILLSDTDLSIGAIAKAVGYERSDSFSKQFHRQTGLLPREYRKLLGLYP